jgi:hypothetical protein
MSGGGVAALIEFDLDLASSDACAMWLGFIIRPFN